MTGESYQQRTKTKQNACLLLLIVTSMLCCLIGCNASDKPASEYIEIPLDMQELQVLQTSVDEGHQPGKMDPEQVCYEFLEQTLQIKSGQTLKLQESKKYIRVYEASIDEQPDLEIYLEQPVKQGAWGIWVVVKYRYLVPNR